MVMYKWDADEDDFAMPVRVGTPDHWQIFTPPRIGNGCKHRSRKINSRWRRTFITWM